MIRMSATRPSDASPIWDEVALVDPHRRDDKAERVRRMFDCIAPTYERVNTVSSLGRDRAWRRRVVKLVGATTVDSVLDVACGTGDLARTFAAAGVARVVGVDFAADMLQRAAQRPTPRTTWCLADAQRLPLADGSFTVASCAFGVRNFQDLGCGLSEMHRILRPGGRAAILEFSLPRGRLTRGAYRFYLERVLPRLAGLMCGNDGGAYRYLARSVVSFVDEAGLIGGLREAGFERVDRHSMTCGIVQVYVARKGAKGFGASHGS